MAPRPTPKLFYDPIRGLIEAIESATSDIPKADVEGTIRAPVVRFIKHYEQYYYRYQWPRLQGSDPPSCPCRRCCGMGGGTCISTPSGAVRGCMCSLRKASKTGYPRIGQHHLISSGKCSCTASHFSHGNRAVPLTHSMTRTSILHTTPWVLFKRWSMGEAIGKPAEKSTTSLPYDRNWESMSPE